jgi:hypothetical protein
MSIEVMAWIVVLLEIQIGVLLILVWLFRAGDGFLHAYLAGIAVTVYADGDGRRPARRRPIERWEVRQWAMAGT